MQNTPKNLADLFTQKSLYDLADLNNLDSAMPEGLFAACKMESVHLEMINILTDAIIDKYNCSRDDIYKYWDDFKKGLVL